MNFPLPSVVCVGSLCSWGRDGTSHAQELEGSVCGVQVEQDVAFIGARRFNLKPCLRGDMTQGNPPSLGFGARALLRVVCTGKMRQSCNIFHFALTARKNKS